MVLSQVVGKKREVKLCTKSLFYSQRVFDVESKCKVKDRNAFSTKSLSNCIFVVFRITVKCNTSKCVESNVLQANTKMKINALNTKKFSC